MVLSLAQFTDGSVMDVSSRAAVTAAVPAGVTEVLPFNLVTNNSTQLQTVNVAAKVSTPSVMTTAYAAMEAGC
jgi:hypothetical protein